jgi:hypothetical protein
MPIKRDQYSCKFEQLRLIQEAITSYHAGLVAELKTNGGFCGTT